MIYNNTSVKRVIAKVLTDLDLREETHRISDMIEWSGEALEKIGAFPSLETKITGKGGTPFLELADYQVALPTDLHNIIQVAYSTLEGGPFYPMRMSTGSFDSKRTLTVKNDDGAGNITYTEEDENIGVTNFSYDYTYFLKPGYLVSSEKEGYIMLSYNAIPTDDDGYPLIPDNIGFIDAIYWYIVMKLYYPMWKIGKIRDAVYYDARRSWNFYCKQAYGNAMMPDSGQLEALKNSWLRLVPEINEQKGFFSTLGQEQRIYNKNNEGYGASGSQLF